MSFAFAPCELCGAIPEYRCGRCEKYAFCSREHQRMVWSFHKLQCESDDFVFPPLTSQRAEVLRASQGVAIEGSMRWPPEVRRMGIWPPRAWSNETPSNILATPWNPVAELVHDIPWGVCADEVEYVSPKDPNSLLKPLLESVYNRLAFPSIVPYGKVLKEIAALPFAVTSQGKIFGYIWATEDMLSADRTRLGTTNATWAEVRRALPEGGRRGGPKAAG